MARVKRRRKRKAITSVFDLSPHQRDILEALAILGGWLRPRDLGARDSHHGVTLRILVDRGYAEARPQMPEGGRFQELRGTALYERLTKRHHPYPIARQPHRLAREYRISEAGKALAAELGAARPHR